jgi:NodT family efflux transporter outer membrane factor (OMF) lipoprotein
MKPFQKRSDSGARSAGLSPTPGSSYRSVLIQVACVGWLSGCAGLPASEPPTPTTLPDTQALAQAQQQLLASEPALQASAPTDWAAWWRLFEDPVLAQLEEQALAANLDLQASAVRVEASRAALGLVQAQDGVQLGAAGGYSRAAISENSPLARLGAYTGGFDTWQLGGEARWELDFWGHVRQQTQAAQARWQASHWEWAVARVSLSAEVARQYWMLRGLQQQHQLQQQRCALAQERVRLLSSRLRHGVATQAELASAQAEQSQTQAQLPALEQRAQGLMNSLAGLLGQLPRSLQAQLSVGTTGAAAWPELPKALPVGVPSERARQRPDVLAAEAKLRAAVADVGAAQADFYPRITLSASLGVQAFALKDLGSWDSRQYSAGPIFYLPVLDGGRLKQNLALSQAHQRSAALAYQQTVLRAWQEVDDALQHLVDERQRLGLLQQASTQSLQALEATRRARSAGAAEALAVLEAQRAWLGTQSAQLDSATAAALSVVALYRALAGGWDGSTGASG